MFQQQDHQGPLPDFATIFSGDLCQLICCHLNPRMHARIRQVAKTLGTEFNRCEFETWLDQTGHSYNRPPLRLRVFITTRERSHVDNLHSLLKLSQTTSHLSRIRMLMNATARTTALGAFAISYQDEIWGCLLAAFGGDPSRVLHWLSRNGPV